MDMGGEMGAPLLGGGDGGTFYGRTFFKIGTMDPPRGSASGIDGDATGFGCHRAGVGVT